MDTTTGMSPPPMDATKFTPSSRAMTVIAASSAMLGLRTKATVRTANAASAPRLNTWRPGSISGLELILADSLR